MKFVQKSKYVMLVLFIISSISIFFVQTNEKAGYIWRAYFYPGTNGSIRGYPILYPPDNFTGTWYNFSYTGKVLSSEEYVNGVSHGKRVFFDDNQRPYYIGHSENGYWASTELSSGVPNEVSIPWFFPQRWINRSLDRLAVLDKLFLPKASVYIGETKEK